MWWSKPFDQQLSGNPKYILSHFYLDGKYKKTCHILLKNSLQQVTGTWKVAISNEQTNKFWAYNDLKLPNPNCPSVRKYSTSTYQRNPFWFMRRVLEDKHIKKFRFSRTPRGAVNGPEKTPLGYLPFTCQLKNCSQIICHLRSALNQVKQWLTNDALEKLGRICTYFEC